MNAKMEPISIARAVVKRATGETEVYYSYDKPTTIRGIIKLHKHLRFMRQEDRDGAYDSR